MFVCVNSRNMFEEVSEEHVRCHTAARGPAQGLAKCARNNIHPAHHITVLVRATTVFAQKTHGVGIVDHDQGPVALRQLANPLQIGDGPVHVKKCDGLDFLGHVLI